MTRSPSKAALLIGTALLSACVTTVDAIVRDEDATFDQRLIGTWVDASDSDAVATVARASPTSYTIRFTEDGKTGAFAARLGRLGARMVLDVRPAPADSEIYEPYQGALLPTHLLFVVDIAADSVLAALVSGDSLRAAIRTGRVKLDTLSWGNHTFITSRTNVVRAALSTHLSRPGAIDAPKTFKRDPRRGR